MITSSHPVDFAQYVDTSYRTMLTRRPRSAWAETQDYDAFLKSKSFSHKSTGKTISVSHVHPILFDYQKDIVTWAVKKGCAAIFADVGLGKTFMQGEWARQIDVPTLFVAPLLVVFQTITALKLLGMDVRYAKSQDDVDLTATKFWITNYHNLEKFQARAFQAVVLDESSILKSFSGETKKLLVRMFKRTPYKLACTATPAPNDLGEIGNHAEFLGVMSSKLMTAVYFTHDSQAAAPGVSKYRLKKHSLKNFYQWLASWAVALKKPSDLGYSDEGYDLPELHTHIKTVPSSYTPRGMLQGMGTQKISATEANRLRKNTIADRVRVVVDLVNDAPDEQFLIWTGLNDEDVALMKALPDAVRVYGEMSNDAKIAAFQSWERGDKRVLITKDSIAGAGMNMQFARNTIFFGIDFSWEAYYQAVGRMHRFGQQREVNVYVVISEQEKFIYDAVSEKGKEAAAMTRNLIQASNEFMRQELSGAHPDAFVYEESNFTTRNGKATLWLGDTCKRIKEIEANSVHFGIHSPPFGNTMFIYSDTAHDLGNTMSQAQFLRQYRIIARELLRITMPGRLHVVHIQDTKLYKNRDGERGLFALSDSISRMFKGLGWILRARVTVQKNPQIVATRNNDNDLLFVTAKRDSSDIAPLNTDYLLVFKKPGDNPVPIRPYDINPLTGRQEMTEEEWIRNAHAIWSGTLEGIRETNTLNAAIAKDSNDEKHLAPLQLDLIEWCIRMWSNPGELVFSPFGGIGSEPYVAVKTGRRAHSIELKRAYWNHARKFVQEAETKFGGKTLFDLINSAPKHAHVDTTKVWVCNECMAESTHELEHTPCDVCGWYSETVKQKRMGDIS